VCGVGDYTFRLHEALDEIYPVDLVHLPITKAREPKLFQLRRDYDLVHIQYPTEGWGNSVLPSAMPFSLRSRGRIVLTLHEWSQMNRLRRASIRPLVKSATELVFVTDSERRAFSAKWKKEKSARVIPIGVNLKFDHDLTRREVLEVRESLLASNKYDMLLTHFGFIHPGKQPVRLLETLEMLRAYGRRPLLVFVGGFKSEKSRDEFSLRRDIHERGLDLLVRFEGFIKDDREASLIMAAGDANLALYTDGVSPRRGSFWFAAQFGGHLVTTEPADIDSFGEAKLAMHTPQVKLVARRSLSPDVAHLLRWLPPFEPFRYAPIPPPSWKSIAEKHAEMYKELLSRP